MGDNSPLGEKNNEQAETGTTSSAILIPIYRAFPRVEALMRVELEKMRRKLFGDNYLGYKNRALRACINLLVSLAPSPNDFCLFVFSRLNVCYSTCRHRTNDQGFISSHGSSSSVLISCCG